MKRTLKRELKVPEIAEGEANGPSLSWRDLAHAMVMASHISASVGVGFDLDVRDASCLVCHRQCGGEDNSWDMVAGSRACECAL